MEDDEAGPGEPVRASLPGPVDAEAADTNSGEGERARGEAAEGEPADSTEEVEEAGEAGEAQEQPPVEMESEPREDSLRFDRWRRRSAAGAMMTGIGLGLQEALVRRKKEPPIVRETSGDPSRPDDPIELRFDPDHPEKTVAVIRPWLMEPNPEDGTEPPT